jgi:hypothetical protein
LNCSQRRHRHRYHQKQKHQSLFHLLKPPPSINKKDC